MMTLEQLLKNLQSPTGPVDVVMDTDAGAEIDDQFAIAYLLRSDDRLNIKGFCAAPFGHHNLEDTMNRSYNEICHVLTLAGREDLLDRVYKGSTSYLTDEKTPVMSDAAQFMADLADRYSPEHPLYILAIGAIPNVASALLLNPRMKENVVVVWLGGNAQHWWHTNEWNMMLDMRAARVIFNSGVPFVQLPCRGVINTFTTTRWELEHWLKGKNALCDYLVENTIKTAERYAAGKSWTRVIWDVTTVAWLLNDDQRFLTDDLRHAAIPEYDFHYSYDNTRHFMKYVTSVNRDVLFEDLFNKLAR